MPRQPTGFGALLRIYRSRRHLLQKDVALKAGIGVSTLSRFESEERFPSTERDVLRLAQALGLSKSDEKIFLEAAFPKWTGLLPLQTEGVELEPGLHKLSTVNNGDGNSQLSLPDSLGIVNESNETFFDGALESVLQSLYLHRARDHHEYKKAIAQWVVKEELNSNTSVLLDSGTTVAEVAYTLVESGKKVKHIYTNSLFVALYLMAKEYPVTLLVGRLEKTEEFLKDKSLLREGSLMGSDVIKQVRSLTFDVSILGAKFIDPLCGPYSSSQEQRAFKRAAMKSSSRVVIAADYSKFEQPPPREFKPVLGDEDSDIEKAKRRWATLLRWKEVAIVTSGAISDGINKLYEGALIVVSEDARV